MTRRPGCRGCPGRPRRAAAIALLAVVSLPTPARAQASHGGGMGHDGDAMTMWSAEVGGWRLVGMGQLFPVWSGTAASGGSPLERDDVYLTQPVAMLNLESPARSFALRVTPNFEGVTLEDGEVTLGGWGEGFIDARHPHTLLHELMLSWNVWTGWGGISLSAGKGFAPYGTEDPMSRPVLKYPTNHHLSQILERWTVNGVVLAGPWSLEAGLFGGGEPEGPYDLSNVDSFGDSWSARATRRFGAERMGSWTWELSGSYGRVREEHHGLAETSSLWNVALRHQAPWDLGRLYGLVEYSYRSLVDREVGDGDGHHGPEEPGDIERDDGDLWSLLAEARLTAGRHQPYGRVEWAVRPEYLREGPPSSEDFLRYDHDDDPFGATRWVITTVGYGWTATRGGVSVRPFVEAQHFSLAAERSNATPEGLFDADRLWGLSVGARIFLGGDPMRMGGYGVLDPMTRMNRMGGDGGMERGMRAGAR